MNKIETKKKNQFLGKGKKFQMSWDLKTVQMEVHFFFTITGFQTHSSNFGELKKPKDFLQSK